MWRLTSLDNAVAFSYTIHAAPRQSTICCVISGVVVSSGAQRDMPP